jgi:hypothetical protein
MPRSAKAARLRHDYKAHIRATQISERRVFAYCEGNVHDPYLYSELMQKAQTSGERYFQLYRIEEIVGTGGKSALVKLFKYMRRKKLLLSNYKSKPYCHIFFLDKDADDVRRIHLRSSHIFYTELYDLEAHIYRDSDLVRAIAVGLSIDLDVVPPAYHEPAGWIEAKAVHWRKWLVLCLFSSIYNLNCGCGYGRTSNINHGLLGMTNDTAFEGFKAQLQIKSRMANSEFDNRFGSVQRAIQTLASKGMLSLVFKGKWLEAIINAELQSVFSPGGKISTVGIGPRISSASMALFDFNSRWAGQHMERISILAAQVLSSVSR